MKTRTSKRRPVHAVASTGQRERARFLSWLFKRSAALVLALSLLPYFVPRAALAAEGGGVGVSYSRDEIKEVPWSIHVVKVDRSKTDLQWTTTMGGGSAFGMSLVSDQVKSLASESGRPLAAINGDFYRGARNYPGDPEGLQIVRGELVSAPSAARSCFWIDSAGNPHLTNAAAEFFVVWPGGARVPFGLNQERSSGTAVLYTRAVGASTRCSGGTELLLEAAGRDAPWLPLKPGVTYSARVRQVSTSGNTSISTDTAVLSLSSSLASRLPRLAPGATLAFSTTTIPSMAGAVTGLGGGPALVRDGKPLVFKGAQPRHPRSAIGWNDRCFFLVEVDGRQSFSAGMTLNELATYMARLGCTAALNLDGGGSATLWVYGNVINNPSEGRERPSANALVLLQDKKRAVTARTP